MAIKFNVEAFKSQVSGTGFLQTNKYAVYITANNALAGSFINSPLVSKQFTAMGNDLNYRCINASLPGMILRTSDNNRFGLGMLEKMPFAGAYTDIDLTFMCDMNGAAYNFWYGWLNYIFASVGKESPVGVVDQISQGTANGRREFYTMQYKDNYTAIVDIIVYDNFGDDAITYKLYQCFPTSINDSPLSWADNNNLLKLTVKMSFREWAIDEGNVLIQRSQNQSAAGQPVQGITVNN